MAKIELDHVTFCYEGGYHNVFEDLTLTLDTDWRLGLIGPNGRGKTTLLRLLTGELKGEGVARLPGRCRYFPTPVADESLMTLEVLSQAAPGAREWELLREAGRLGVEEELLYRPFATLSGGERTRALLAALFLDEGCYPLIDEPTNHLDEAGRALVARYLSRQRGFLLVSHDRAFLDGSVDHILALERTGARVMAGNYSTWEEEWEARNAWEGERDRQLRREIGQLKAAARRTGEWSDRVERSKEGSFDKGYIGHMAAKMAKRSKAIQARQLAAAEEKEGLLRNTEEAQPLKLRPLAFQGRSLLSLRKAAPVYDGRPVCSPVDLQLSPGERVAIIGPNGCGKTSLLRLLLGEELAHTGEVDRPGRLVVSYVPQGSGRLRGRLEENIRAWGVDPALCRTILRKLGFERRDFERDLSALSAGQRKKILLAKSLCESAHLYVWDEPLNYVDLFSRRQIEEVLLEYTPTLVFVEHDRTFRERVATRVVEVEGAE